MTYDRLPEDASSRYSSAALTKLARGLGDLEDLALTAEEQRREAMRRAVRMSIQGVQPKLSTRLAVRRGRFEIIDRGGTYILKPQSQLYDRLPENEDLTMKLAAATGIQVPLHGLLWARDESLTYFIRRFDRKGRGAKVAVEDFAQLSGRSRLTKYNSSMERVAAVIDRYCTFPSVEKLELFRRTLFCYLTGNEDMHLKNFSLIDAEGIIKLAPGYDFVNTSIVLTGAREEFALPLRGKKRLLRREDLVGYWGRSRLELNEKTVSHVLQETESGTEKWPRIIGRSFLPEEGKKAYLELFEQRARVLFGGVYRRPR